MTRPRTVGFSKSVSSTSRPTKPMSKLILPTRRQFIRGAAVALAMPAIIRPAEALSPALQVLLSKRPVAASGYSAEATTLFAAMSSQPDATRKGHIDTCIGALKTAGVWTKLDVLYVFAAHDSQASLLNWKNPATFNAAVAAATVTFTTDRGHTGDGASGYIDSGFNASTAGGNFVRDSAHLAVWSGTEVQASSIYEVGTTGARINSRDDATLGFHRLNSGSSQPITVANSIGWICIARNNSSNYDNVKNLGTVANETEASLALANLNFFICCQNDAGSLSGPSSRRVQAVHWGSYIDDTERDATYNALNTYMVAVGAA